MADFLANLAARSLGQLPGIRPRRPSLFESEAAPIQEPTSDELDIEIEVEPAFQVSSPARHNTASRPGAPDDDDSELMSDHAPMGTEDGESAKFATRRTVEIRDVVSASHDTASPASEERRPDWDALERTQLSPPPERDVPRPAEDPLSELSAATAGPRPRTPRTDEASKPLAAPPNRIEDVTETVSVRQVDALEAAPSEQQASATETVAVAPRIETRIATQSAASEAGVSPEPEPAGPQVTVSIGRVEVKAAPQSEPVRPLPPPTRTKPAMSLDAYLERSRRRGR